MLLLACDDAMHCTLSRSALDFSENLFLKASPPAHSSMLLSRGRRNRTKVASKSSTIGAIIHNDESLIRHQGEGRSFVAQVLP